MHWGKLLLHLFFASNQSDIRCSLYQVHWGQCFSSFFLLLSTVNIGKYFFGKRGSSSLEVGVGRRHQSRLRSRSTVYSIWKVFASTSTWISSILGKNNSSSEGRGHKSIGNLSIEQIPHKVFLFFFNPSSVFFNGFAFLWLLLKK